MKVEMFIKQIQQRFELIMPNGLCSVDRMRLGKTGFTIRLGLIKETSDCLNGIRQNDQGHTLIFMRNIPQDMDAEVDIVEVEFDGCNIATVPSDPYMAMGRHKVATRKFKQEPKKALKSLESFFMKYKAAFAELAAENKIYGQDRIKPEYLDFN